MASVKVDIITLFCEVASASSLSSAKVVAFIVATIEATRAFCDFCDFESLVQAWGDIWFHISQFTRGVRKPLTLPGRGYLSIGVWTLSSWSLSLRRPFRSFTSPSSTSFPVFSSMSRSCTISASSLLPEAVVTGVLLVSPAFRSFPPTGVAASSSLLSAGYLHTPHHPWVPGREATVCFNSFISFITDLNMTAKFCVSERLGEPSPGLLVSFSAKLFCGLQLRWSAGSGFSNLPIMLVWYSVFYGLIVFPTALRNGANLVKKLRSSSRRRQSCCKYMCHESHLCGAISWDLLACIHVIESGIKGRLRIRSWWCGPQTVDKFQRT